MKIIKRIFLGIAFLITLFCVMILYCALNPAVTSQLAEAVEAVEAGQRPVAAGDGLSIGQADSRLPGQNGSATGINAGWIKDQGNHGYVTPGSQPAEPPESVNGRGGYEPVTEDLEQILEEEADNLSDVIATGELGDDLSFASELYPYYAMLEPDLQQLYRQIYANAQKLNTSFIPAVEVNVNQVKTVFEAVYNDHPEMFWLETGYSCTYLGSGRCVELILKYNGTADYLDQAKEEFNRQAEVVLSGARTMGTAFE